MVRMRMTKGKRGSRQSHHKVKTSPQVEEGGVFRPRHKASRVTGLYRGKKVLDISDRKKNSAEEVRGANEKGSGEKKTTEQAEIPQVTT